MPERNRDFLTRSEDHVVIIRPDRPAKQEGEKGDLEWFGNGSRFRADSGSNCPVERYLRGCNHGCHGKISNGYPRTKRGVFIVFVCRNGDTGSQSN